MAVPLNRAVAWPSTAVIAWMRERIAESGGDPSLIPDEPTALWRLRVVMQRTGLARPTLYRLAARGQFPRPVRLSGPKTQAA
jgi:predicted DNA-binding transcriptional regulator AlpA